MDREIFGSLIGNRVTKMCLLTVLWGCVALPVLAHKGVPPPGTQQAQPLAGLPQLVLPATDVRSELAADAQVGKAGPLRYAVARPVSITPDTAGTRPGQHRVPRCVQSRKRRLTSQRRHLRN